MNHWITCIHCGTHQAGHLSPHAICETCGMNPNLEQRKKQATTKTPDTLLSTGTPAAPDFVRIVMGVACFIIVLLIKAYFFGTPDFQSGVKRP
jgi:uncharacterized membrane protein YvbJ